MKRSWLSFRWRKRKNWKWTLEGHWQSHKVWADVLTVRQQSENLSESWTRRSKFILTGWQGTCYWREMGWFNRKLANKRWQRSSDSCSKKLLKENVSAKGSGGADDSCQQLSLNHHLSTMLNAERGNSQMADWSFLPLKRDLCLALSLSACSWGNSEYFVFSWLLRLVPKRIYSSIWLKKENRKYKLHFTALKFLRNLFKCWICLS